MSYLGLNSYLGLTETEEEKKLNEVERQVENLKRELPKIKAAAEVSRWPSRGFVDWMMMAAAEMLAVGHHTKRLEAAWLRRKKEESERLARRAARDAEHYFLCAGEALLRELCERLSVEREDRECGEESS